MRLEWAWAIPVMSLLLNPQTPSSRSTWESRAQKPPDSPESPQPPGAVTQTGPTDCLSYRIEENPQSGTTTVTCIFGGGGGFTFPYGGGGGGGGGGTSPGGGGGGGGSGMPGIPIGGNLAREVNNARSLALQKLANKPPCAALFAGYPPPWNSGTYILDSYVTFREGSGTSRCSSGTPPTAAWTEIASSPAAPVIHSDFIVICGGFANISSDGERANRLIHEGLHVAGLRERPGDPTAMSTQEIDGMVREACGP